MFDLSNVLNSAQQVKKQADQNQGNGGNRRKLIYPADGSVRVKLLFNPKSGIALRKIGRHHVHGVKVPCLEMYGKDCPICKTVSDIKAVKGTDLWEFKRKERGLSYAQYIGDNYNRQNDKPENIPAEGEIILLMYPWSAYRDLQSIIAEAGPNAASILATNHGKVVKITRSKGKSNRIEYRVELDAFSEYKTANSDEEYMKLLNELPNLNDEIVSSELTEDIMKTVKEVTNKLHESYLSPAVAGGFNPNAGNPSNLGQFAGGAGQPQGGMPAWAQGGQAQPNQQFQQPGQFQQPTQQFQQPGQQFQQPNQQSQQPNQQFQQPVDGQPQWQQPQSQPTDQSQFQQPDQQFQQPEVSTQSAPQETQQPEANPNVGTTTPGPTTQSADPTTPRADGKPSCFGMHGSVDANQCLICPHEVECTGATA